LSCAFILAASEIGSTILLYAPGKETLLIALFSVEANSPRAQAASLAAIQLVLTALPAGVIFGLTQLSSWSHK
jgi:ABC-type Fe3+ transport system permease subunit